MEKAISLYGRQFKYEDAAYGVVKGYHQGNAHYVPFSVSKLEMMARQNSRLVTKHIIKVDYETIDFVLRRPEEFKFSSEESENLKRTRQLFQKIYTSLEKAIGTPGTD